VTEFLVEFEVAVPDGTPESEPQLDGLLRALPRAAWMHVTVAPLLPHPNDPARAR
jgi:muconolactone delta-isomerase